MLPPMPDVCRETCARHAFRECEGRETVPTSHNADGPGGIRAILLREAHHPIARCSTAMTCTFGLMQDSQKGLAAALPGRASFLCGFHTRKPRLAENSAKRDSCRSQVRFGAPRGKSGVQGHTPGGYQPLAVSWALDAHGVAQAKECCCYDMEFHREGREFISIFGLQSLNQ